MCGINGMVLLKKDRTPEQVRLLKFLYGEILMHTQSRGKDATGVAVFNRDGEYILRKRPLKAYDYLLDPSWGEVANFINEDTAIILGHVRLGTQGPKENNDNNHPFDIGNVVGVHNGTIQNDGQLFNQFQFERIGQVDSEIIFQLINHYNNDGITYEGLKLALEDSKLRGAFALGFVHKNEPTRVHIVKQERPMTVTYWKEMGALIFNSEDTYVETGFETIKRLVTTFGLDVSVDFKYATIDINDDLYFSMTADAVDLADSVTMPQPLVIAKNWAYNYQEEDYKDYYHGGAGTSTTTTGGATVLSSKETQTFEELASQSVHCDECSLTDLADCTKCNHLYLSSNEEDDEDGEDLTGKCTKCKKTLEAYELENEYNEEYPDEQYCWECGQDVMMKFYMEKYGVTC